MPSFEEIYTRHADRYDQLLRREDYQHNLGTLLHKLFDWKGKKVVEAGIGTARVSRLFIDEVAELTGYDLSPHMLEGARRNLAGHLDKVTLDIANNLELSRLNHAADCFIEGWSFGHSVCDAPGTIREKTATLLTGCRGLVAPGGTIILIETLSTNADKPAPPSDQLAEFYALLEGEYGFRKEIADTAYRFESREESVDLIQFFFGEEMAELVANRDSLIVPEYTGIWHKTV